MPTTSGKPTKAEAAPHLCQWFHGCTKEATTERFHPILGVVPVCAEHQEWPK